MRFVVTLREVVPIEVDGETLDLVAQGNALAPSQMDEAEQMLGEFMRGVPEIAAPTPQNEQASLFMLGKELK